MPAAGTSRVKQAGAIAIRGTGADVEVLLVRAKKNPRHWIFPKGHVESGETLEQAAMRELREEAGVVGEMLGPIGVSRFRSGDENVDVHYFLARAIADEPIRERAIQWLRFSEAREALTFDDARTHLDRLEMSLARGTL